MSGFDKTLYRLLYYRHKEILKVLACYNTSNERSLSFSQTKEMWSRTRSHYGWLWAGLTTGREREKKPATTQTSLLNIMWTAALSTRDHCQSHADQTLWSLGFINFASSLDGHTSLFWTMYHSLHNLISENRAHGAKKYV